MSLRAPLAVVVQILADERRWFRLSRNIGTDGLRLERGVPLEPGRPIEVRLTLPLAPPLATTTPGGEDATVLSLRAEATGDAGSSSQQPGSDELAFIDPSRDSRQLILRYVKERLGLNLP